MSRALVVIEDAPARGAAVWSPERLPALTPVANTPLMLHAVDAVRRAGAEEVVVAAAADTAAVVRGALGPAADGLRWLTTGSGAGTVGALGAAAGLLAGGRFLLHVADGMVVRDHGTLAAALADEDVDATVFFHDERIAGVHAFGPAMLDAARQVDGDAPARLVDAVERLAATGGRVQAGVLEGWWPYRGSSDALLELNRLVLDEIETSIEAEDLAGARIEGRVRIHPTAIVRRSIVRGPAVLGARARVTDAFVGPYSAIGDGAVIDNAQVASSIVLPRARIRHVGVRVEDSIVGPGATVGRDFGVSHAIRVLVGSDAQVTLS